MKISGYFAHACNFSCIICLRPVRCVNGVVLKLMSKFFTLRRHLIESAASWAINAAGGAWPKSTIDFPHAHYSPADQQISMKKSPSSVCVCRRTGSECLRRDCRPHRGSAACLPQLGCHLSRSRPIRSQNLARRANGLYKDWSAITHSTYKLND